MTFPSRRQFCQMPALLAPAWAQAAQLGPALPARYRMTEIPPFPGQGFSFAVALNSVGQVLAESRQTFTTDTARPFLWQPDGSRQIIEPPRPVAWTAGIGLADDGLVIGDLVFENESFWWTAETGAQAIALPPELNSLGLRSIRRDGLAVGAAAGPGIAPHAVSWRLEQGLTRLSPQTDWVRGVAVNAQDEWLLAKQIGSRSEQALLASPEGAVRALRRGSFGTDLNDAGLVVGYFNTGDHQQIHAFAYRRGQGFQDLGALPGLRHSSAAAVNAQGTVVGTSYRALDERHAFVWNEAEGLLDLNTRIDPAWARRLRLAEAMDVNERGQIVANAELPNGQSRAVLLSPSR